MSSVDPEVANQTHALLPLLIYDGSCDFCYYWVEYWQKLTGNSVTYKPYQEVTSQFPQIPVEEFQRAVQYVAPDGKISSAAEASYLTLSHARGKGFWLKLYRRLPGFAFLTEKAYTFVSRRRSFFYTLSLWVYGRHYEPPRYDIVSWLFVRGVALIYFFAFLSFGMQSLGLIGSQGIIPVAKTTEVVYQHIGAIGYRLYPMVFWFNASDFMVQATCWVGALLSLVLFFNIIPRISLILLYGLYLSLCSAGLFFMSFQWDIYILEVGILTLFLFGWSKPIGIWLLRWLLFRFIFAGGMVKILSGDPTWRDLSALSYYFITEPLPTPLAYYAAHLPDTVLTFCTGAALFIEIFVPFLIFFPRRIRFAGALTILFMQTLILLTGNYNFFNLLTMLLCLVCFDDAALQKILPLRFTQWIPKTLTSVRPHKIASAAAITFVIVTVSISLLQFYVRFGGTVATPIAMAADYIAPLRIVNTYGPFAVMTTKRDELILEGSRDGKTWVEYSFKYKPGDVLGPLKWNIPFQPRLDWQMWFAALGSLRDNIWLNNLVGRILTNSPAVIGLLGTNPFPDVPPLYLRFQIYDYQFTSSKERDETDAVWKRTLIGQYMAASHLE